MYNLNLHTLFYNTGAAAVDSLEGLGGLGDMGGPKGIFTKGAFKPKPVIDTQSEIVNDSKFLLNFHLY